MIASLDLHFWYVVMMLLGLSLTFAFPMTKHFSDPQDRRRYYTMQVVTIVCAVLGAKIAVVLGDALWPLKEFHDWGALLTGGAPSPAHCCSGFSGRGSQATAAI